MVVNRNQYIQVETKHQVWTPKKNEDIVSASTVSGSKQATKTDTEEITIQYGNLGQDLSANTLYGASAKNMDRTITVPSSSTTAGNCNLGTKDIVIDKTFSISNCTPNQINELRKACLKKNNIIVLRTGNKVVAEHQVTANINGGSFTCQTTRWFEIKEINSKFAPVDEWASETNPSYTDCQTTCNQIQPYTEIVDQNKNEIEGREFPGNKQCVAACAQKVKDACNELINEPWGNRTIQKTEAFYKMDSKNILRYGCKYS